MICIYLSSDFVQTPNTILGKKRPGHNSTTTRASLWCLDIQGGILHLAFSLLTQVCHLQDRTCSRQWREPCSNGNRYIHEPMLIASCVLLVWGFFLPLQYFTPLVCCLLLTVLALTLILYSFLRSFVMAFDVFLLFLRLKWFYDSVLPSCCDIFSPSSSSAHHWSCSPVLPNNLLNSVLSYLHPFCNLIATSLTLSSIVNLGLGAILC